MYYTFKNNRYDVINYYILINIFSISILAFTSGNLKNFIIFFLLSSALFFYVYFREMIMEIKISKELNKFEYIVIKYLFFKQKIVLNLNEISSGINYKVVSKSGKTMFLKVKNNEKILFEITGSKGWDEKYLKEINDLLNGVAKENV